MARNGALGPRIALWGTYDRGSPESAIKVFETEMRRRLPFAQIVVSVPRGRNPRALDGGPLDILGDWSEERARQLASAVDLLVVDADPLPADDDHLAGLYGAGSEERAQLQASAFFIDGPGPGGSGQGAVAWYGACSQGLTHALMARLRTASEGWSYVAVPDRASKCVLEEAGIQREVVVVGPPALLAGRVFHRDALDRRLRYMRQMQWYPLTDRPVLFLDAEVPADVVSMLMGSGIPTPVVVSGYSTGVVGEQRHRMADQLFELPDDATTADVVSAMAHASAVVASRPAHLLAAAGLGVPAVAWGQSAPEGVDVEAVSDGAAVERVLASLLASDAHPGLRGPNAMAGLRGPNAVAVAPTLEMRRRLDAHFDALALLAEQAACQRLLRGDAGPRVYRALAEASERFDTLLEAHVALKQRLVAHRLAAPRRRARSLTRKNGRGLPRWNWHWRYPPLCRSRSRWTMSSIA